ncbi:MAG: S8 family serine peptidase, partial [Deltaproteobacteria bacterium]|nr:S8 family serine peptidase [Deltaproteobacteria bacterium]
MLKFFRFLSVPSFVFLIPHLFSLSSFAAEPPGPRRAHIQDEIIVRFHEGVHEYNKALAHFDLGARAKKVFKTLRGLELVKLPPGLSVKEALKLYQQHPDVLYAEPNYIVKALVGPNDPRFGGLWGLHNTGQAGGTNDADIDAPEAWGITTGSSDVVVAVIDTGVDYNHQDLSTNMFRNEADCNNNGVDDDGNGFVNDCHGIDTANDDSNPMDDHNHGTHVAGTIGAVGNNAIGVVGVNWDVSIMACKFLNANGSGTTADAIDCLDYVKIMKDRGVNIVATSNSWGGGGFSQALFDAIDAHRQRGILFIAAAGNDSSDNDTGPHYPSNYDLPNVISVAATTRNDVLASFSNFGRRTVHVGAPGSEILSTTRNNTYSTFSGTSMATPHVTGVAALLKAQDSGRDWRAIKNLILAGGDNNPSMSNSITGKRLNANGALICSNSTVLSRLRPISDTITGSIGTPIDLAALHINCADPNGNVSVTVDPGGQMVTLMDDGLGIDQAEGDGIYSGQWTPSA